MEEAIFATDMSPDDTDADGFADGSEVKSAGMIHSSLKRSSRRRIVFATM